MKKHRSICKFWRLKIKSIVMLWKKSPKTPDAPPVTPNATRKLPSGGFGTSAMPPEKRIKHLTHLLQSEQVLHSLARRHLKALIYRQEKMSVLLREILAKGQMTEEQKVAYDLLYMEDGDD